MEMRTWTSIHEETINENIKRKMFWGENIMVVKWELAPHAELPVHDHVSEQITMMEQGTLTLLFPGGEDVTLGSGEMLVIPSTVPHGVVVGPEGAIATDIFSPIRKDFIDKTAMYLVESEESGAVEGDRPSLSAEDQEKYRQFQSFLTEAGIEIPLEKLVQAPLELLARYVYERECISMGQLRNILGIDKKQAKQLLREWKHGDDHSESSLKKAMQRRVILPWEVSGTDDQ